jgi:hypothetical protein
MSSIAKLSCHPQDRVACRSLYHNTEQWQADLSEGAMKDERRRNKLFPHAESKA